jgi:hypothetical protein
MKLAEDCFHTQQQQHAMKIDGLPDPLNLGYRETWLTESRLWLVVISPRI